jgi:hypothetical protein
VSSAFAAGVLSQHVFVRAALFGGIFPLSLHLSDVGYSCDGYCYYPNLERELGIDS